MCHAPMSGRRPRRAFTLLEAVIASTVLAITVLAIGAAISSAQQAAHEGQKAVLGAMACSDYMGELMTLPYAEIEARSGELLAVGTLTTLDGVAYPDSYRPLGRTMVATEQLVTIAGLGVTVRGLLVEVSTFDDERVVARVETFLPEPAE